MLLLRISRRAWLHLNLMSKVHAESQYLDGGKVHIQAIKYGLL